MGAVKQAASMVECDYCGQLVMFDAITKITVADGPDDFVEQGLCDRCAEEYAALHQDEPEMELGEEEEDETE